MTYSLFVRYINFMQSPKDYTNLFLDMNAFFASVEQQVRPNLRGKPVCVAPYPGDTGCCIAKSYEAKPFGITTGTSVGEAKKACPGIEIVESHPELYMFYHRQIRNVLDSFSPFVKPLSIDEFNIKLTGSDQNQKASFKMATSLKLAIRHRVGDYLKCSVGVSSSPWLAKVAGELKKPDGLTILTLKELPALYRTLELVDLPGINYRMAAHLRYRKIKTPFDFLNQPLFNLSRWFGHSGRMWHYRLRGYEIDEAKTAVKSIGHQHVLAPKYRTLKSARGVLAKLTVKCATRLRTKNLWAGGVAVGIKFLGSGGWAKNISTDLISDTQNIQRVALALYDSCRVPKLPLKVSVTLFNLKTVRGEQISLFSDLEKSKGLSKAIDKINDKFGENTIYPGSMFDTEEAAPNRIPFGDPGRLGF